MIDWQAVRVIFDEVNSTFPPPTMYKGTNFWQRRCRYHSEHMVMLHETLLANCATFLTGAQIDLLYDRAREHFVADNHTFVHKHVFEYCRHALLWQFALIWHLKPETRGSYNFEWANSHQFALAVKGLKYEGAEPFDYEADGTKAPHYTNINWNKVQDYFRPHNHSRGGYWGNITNFCVPRCGAVTENLELQKHQLLADLKNSRLFGVERLDRVERVLNDLYSGGLGGTRFPYFSWYHKHVMEYFRHASLWMFCVLWAAVPETKKGLDENFGTPMRVAFADAVSKYNYIDADRYAE